ncbi:vascular cell adhesion protein 1-like isoform X1 [Cottoperca gobio]|uniref:Vascular cell adhesion protein 1-like isoform X1 n=1 Tax=Cottoperca gobio TaxID=56716 RepID=A0A6J2RVB0_COTGO|nr:vascular cell adhesion protein 1-like isoform X1 [Cottoperca gobio]
MAVQSVRLVTANMLLSVFFLSGAYAACDRVAHLSITTPQKMEALSGSCLHIPCTFTPDESSGTFDGTKPISGMWKKGNVAAGQVIFDSSRSDNIYPMNITGDLSQNNCTTLFSSLISNYTNTYFFRIENKPFLATADCDPLQIKVKDSPPSPTIEISGDVKENVSVTISCSAATPCPHDPPQLTWTLQQNPDNIIKENADRTFTTKIQKTFILSDQHDGLNITCSASYPVNEGTDHKTAEETKTLNVSYAPKNTSTSISPSSGWATDSRVNLSCSSTANPPVSSFTWFKKSNDGAVRVSEGRCYSFNVTGGGVYYCVATNGLGNQTSSDIQLTVEDPAKDFMVVSPADPVSVGSEVNLTCSFRGNPPVSFVWLMVSSDGSLQQIKGDSQVHGFKVTNSDRGRLFFCGCRNYLDNKLSTGRQLIFEGEHQSGPVDVEVIVKILGIIMLVSTMIIFECWFRSRHATKPVKDAVEADYVNSVVELKPS